MKKKSGVYGGFRVRSVTIFEECHVFIGFITSEGILRLLSVSRCSGSALAPLRIFKISPLVNAIDHVDDIYKTALEIKRLLKSGGKIRIHAHYHKKTVTESLELNDEVMAKAFSWCEGFKKYINYPKITKIQRNYFVLD